MKGLLYGSAVLVAVALCIWFTVSQDPGKAIGPGVSAAAEAAVN